MPADRVLRQGLQPQETAEEPSQGSQIRVEGTFHAPSGRTGSMSGWLRLCRFEVRSGRLYAVGVFTGELRDANATRIGVGSRRKAAPAEIRNGPDGTIAEIGPVEVDLLGLMVDVRPFTIGVGPMVSVAADGDPPTDADSRGSRARDRARP